MKIWVDYTNWHGKRAWREILGEKRDNRLVVERGFYNDGNGGIERDILVLNVRMVDRDNARRTLKVEKIHGLHFGETSP